MKLFSNQKLVLSCLLLSCFLFPYNTMAQTTTETDSVKCPIKSLPDLFKKKDSLHVIKPIKNSFFIIIPVIGSQPATGFMFGFTGQYTFKGKSAEDKYSTINLGAQYTEKNQLLINCKNSLMLNHNKITLSGDWRYYIFTQPNYGLGTDIIPPIRNEDEFYIEDITEPMDYNYLKFHQTVSWRVKGDFYIGTGVHIDLYGSIIDEKLDVANGIFTEHYNYNLANGFSDTDYFVNGMSLNLLYDSRDNQINANHGSYANINYRVNPALNGNQKPSSILFAEYRHFIPLSKTNKQHVLGFWTYGQFVTSGVVPYLNLPAIGWDARSRGGKGYVQGLFRGNNLSYFEVEYRFPIGCNQLISGTVYSNFTSASDTEKNIKMFDYIQPAAGVGLRILIDKATRTNLIANYAWGRRSKAFYLNAGESF
jgi:outer membrane protein assembly factor BamA